MLNVVCVFKSTSAYGIASVQRLKDGVSRHLSIPYQFVCLSDCTIPGVETIPLTMTGSCAKFELFRPDLFDGPVLHLDPSVLIVGNIDALAGPWPSLLMLGEQPKAGDSACMWWDASEPIYGAIYERHTECLSSLHQKPTSPGDRSLISDTLRAHGEAPGRWHDHLPAEWFVRISRTIPVDPDTTTGIPEDARLIYGVH